MKNDPSACSYTVTDALYDLTMDNLEALARALNERGLVLKEGKADRIIEQLNKCLGGHYDD